LHATIFFHANTKAPAKSHRITDINLDDRENNTTACRLLGAGAEHRKAPQKTIIIQKKKKKENLQPPSLDPNPTRPNQTKENNKHQTARKHEQVELHP
jgi:hypothetical protein